ncbi:uncharacterized protein LOC109544510 isoform X1 [Dendroctonus ponderosae]|uniref:uncharacterized protein LOC109544510 isoform X1 n=1 Tax=Dendroctonus ponderosae TaxID=77166 RepID=UPI002035DC31|nr:uncharacterized protein LOC109544510 isoform X1 [Dendroctonus ponderosae]XP_019770311.2 uncharacterized protein LOC109544510 isoform X1 [Dendroctonus ponderosae]XP_019770312.2 uncharacterized protein LOC109544510 isoform X1 [Dendroctonus ponderosae]XP_048520176.1 uncharacterized protein LOC109544510 isoform X1 [Dendroctonus ponderosae]
MADKSNDGLTGSKKCSSIDYISHAEHRATLKYRDNANNPVTGTNPVILACKQNKVKTLERLLGNCDKTPCHLSIRGTTILPDDEDETCHNAFYYAVRSGSVELLETLISKWPGNYFAIHTRKLDELLSRAYADLKLKNVPLSEKIQLFVEEELINLRFFCEDPQQDENVENLFIQIGERIELVLQNMSLLNKYYANGEKVDEKFLFIAKFIAQNIHILKRRLKSTYNILPWEEMEFCIVGFVSSHMKQKEINLFYNAILNKNKILAYMKTFSKILEEAKDNLKDINIGTFHILPNLKREKAVAKIVSTCPQLEELYSDYQQIRDIESLEKISRYVNVALSADPKKREGQLIVTRTLQVIGEHFKNTLESPKLSNTTSQLLLQVLPKDTRQIITSLRNSLSHAYSLSKRIEIENNAPDKFFTGIKNDISKIDKVITDILYNNKIRMIRRLLMEIVNSESYADIKEVLGIFSNVDLDRQVLADSVKIIGHDKLEKIINELNNSITDKTIYEKALFTEIESIINFANTKLKNIKTDFVKVVGILEVLAEFKWKKMTENDIRCVKLFANGILQDMFTELESHNLKKIADLVLNIFKSCMSRKHGNLDQVNILFCELVFVFEFQTTDLRWIEEFKRKLNEKMSFIFEHSHTTNFNTRGEHYNNQLELKLSELKNILRNNSLDDSLIETISQYKTNEKLQVILEMLLLDILSIMPDNSKKQRKTKQHFLDNIVPLLTGKWLRDHLAHYNTIVDVLLSDPTILLILNAKKLILEGVKESKKNIDKLFIENLPKLKDNYEKDLTALTVQEKMFDAAKKGNLENLKMYLQKGADINARSINAWTTLHFAASGASLNVVKFVIEQQLCVDVKDVNNQSPLHIAATHGNKIIVDFFIRETDIHVDVVDNAHKTPLHFASANGHNDIVEILVKNHANTSAKDSVGLSPLHYAIYNNHVAIAKFLLEKEDTVDINEAMSGFTPLHIAAESGSLELVIFLLDKGANVNGRSDEGATPLNGAVRNGYLEVVNVLILKGANVNSRFIDGSTPLYIAIANGHEKIANVLLKAGANVNVVDRVCNQTPLHYAARFGYENIVETLLMNKANTDIATNEGVTPAHLAAQGGHSKVIATLLQNKVNIFRKDNSKWTPLHYAAENGHTTVAHLLIQNGLAVNDKTIYSATPLHIAALQGHKEFVELLLKNNAQISGRDWVGNTPLHAAVSHGSNDITALLIKNKAEVDVRSNNGTTPLHFAARRGHKDVTAFLIENKAKVDTAAKYGFTPLHAAIAGGHKDIVILLIRNKVNVNVRDSAGGTPLLLAVEAGHKEIVDILIANYANVNFQSDNRTPLVSAIQHYYKEIAAVLIENGASVNEEQGAALLMAVLAGYKDLVKLLLKHNARVDFNVGENATVLHAAAKRGHKEIVNDLLAKGANADARDNHGLTPLYIAASEGHEYVAEVLIANRANVNFVNMEGAPLHRAAAFGHVNVVSVLLRNGAKVDNKDKKKRTALELAVARNHFEVVRLLMGHKPVDMNSKGNDDFTLLHIASQEGNLEVASYLVDKGCSIDARNNAGSKPIHIAAREGHEATVKYFLSKGLSVNELGAANQTVIHYAAMTGQLNVVKFLIMQGANINAKDLNCCTPLHLAAENGYKDVIQVLLQNGAIYNAVTSSCLRPLDIARNQDVIYLLGLIDQLFNSVKRNISLDVETHIRSGAVINSKNANNLTPLHYATWKGYHDVVKILLRNKANSNMVDEKNFTSLHYAVKFSHLEIVKTLLSYGAIYNAVSASGKTPSDLSVDADITSLLKLISDCFEKVEARKTVVIKDLNKIKHIDKVKSVMGARNKENKTLVVVGIQSKFSKVAELKQIFQVDVSAQIHEAYKLLELGNYQRALKMFRSALERRKEIFGPDNPSTLDIQRYIALTLYKQGHYQDALKIFIDNYQKLQDMLGLHNPTTLETRSNIALVLHRQGKYEEALIIFREVYEEQREVLGSNNTETVNTKFHMALVLNRLGHFHEALCINKAVYKARKESLGPYDINTISAQNNIAVVLVSQHKSKEALEIFQQVLKKKETILGINHSDTLRTLSSISTALFAQHKYTEALQTAQKVLNIQKSELPPNHPQVLNSQYALGNIFFAQGKLTLALKAYTECVDQIKVVFGATYPAVSDILQKIEAINVKLRYLGVKSSDVLLHLQKDINVAASRGDLQTVQLLLKDGANSDGRTPLHFAISAGHIDIVNLLIKNGASVTEVTNKGNTPLHTATSKGNKEIAELLLQHVKPKKLNNFVNAKTAYSGSTALHVAAKAGFGELVRSLLKHGAAYKIENRAGETPINISKDQTITNLLTIIAELFQEIVSGNVESINKLRSVTSDDLLAITNARNDQGNTLLQVAIANGKTNVTYTLLEILKTQK